MGPGVTAQWPAPRVRLNRTGCPAEESSSDSRRAPSKKPYSSRSPHSMKVRGSGPEADARMQKCDLCLERLEEGQQTICVEACPVYALDVGPLDELRDRYGEGVEAVGFSYSERFKPSVVFRPKPRS